MGPRLDTLQELFDLTEETSLPDWFSAVLLLTISLTLWLIRALVRSRGAHTGGWLALASFFSFLTLANGARLYRRLGAQTERHFEALIRSSGETGLRELMASDHAENVLLVLAAGPLGLAALVFLWRALRGDRARPWLIAAAVGFAAAGAMRIFESDSTHVALSMLLELASGAVLWLVLLRHAFASTSEVRLTIGDGPRPQECPDGVSAFHIGRSRTMRRLVLACILIQLGFVLADYFIALRALDLTSHIRAMFNVARENSLPNWFSSMQTLAVGLTALLVYLVVRARGASAGMRRGWMFVALFFVYMALDDGTRLHERLGSFFGELLAGGRSGGILDGSAGYSWHVVFLPLFVAAGLFTAWFLLRESPAFRVRVVVLLALGLLAASVGLDFLESLDKDHPWNPYVRIVSDPVLDYKSRALFDHSAYWIARHFSKVLEEILEMLANTLLWSVVLGRLFDLGAEMRVRLRAAPTWT
ncbi:MAG: hypothetical protein GY716_18250 [bacterium]|nr:hypothetical protein [bacterium]